MTDLGFIVKMVIYKCRELGNPVTETLAAYVAQTSLNPGKELTFFDNRNFMFRDGTFLFGKTNKLGRSNGFSRPYDLKTPTDCSAISE